MGPHGQKLARVAARLECWELEGTGWPPETLTLHQLVVLCTATPGNKGDLFILFWIVFRLT